MEVIKSAHTVYCLKYHVVWVCKYRRRVLNPGVCEYLKTLLPKLLKNTPGIVIETIGFDGDHLHMVMVIPPKFAVSQIMGKLKSQSASALRKKFSWLEKVFWKENIVWSPGYFVSSIGLDEDVVRRYVEHQGQGGFRSNSNEFVTVRTPGMPGGIYFLVNFSVIYLKA